MADESADETTLTGYLEALGSSASTPGGGAASALAAALAAALVEMVAQLTVGRPKYAAVEERVREIIEQLRAVRARLLRLMADDERAFAGVSAAYKLPKTSDDERAARERAIQAALLEAMRPPLAVMTSACDALALAEEIARIGNGTVASDAGCAAILGEAAVRSASLNVLANVVLIHDEQAATEAHQRVADFEARAADLQRRTMATARKRMGLQP
ncbi:MAG TPA: cyclodeaminase/cyclohydrolase family protein [Ktedonobacterales bacterium]|nr:cyclodeaminase/cyclohydrolase family protein [Ktedonobacterales bacterium]